MTKKQGNNQFQKRSYVAPRKRAYNSITFPISEELCDDEVVIYQEVAAKEKQVEEEKERQVEELAKQVASLSAEKSEIMRKLEKVQAELSRKEKEKEDAARLSMQQGQSEHPQEQFRSLDALDNGHVTERPHDSFSHLSSGNIEDGNLRRIRATKERLETAMPRLRLPRCASGPVSFPARVQRSGPVSNGDLHDNAASGSPAMTSLGSSRRSALAPKHPMQEPRQLQGRSLPSSHSRALVLHGSSAEKRRRISTGGVEFQSADVELPLALVRNNRHSLPSGEVYLGAGAPVPATPSPGCPSSVNPDFTPAQQICALNQESQTLVAVDHRSSSFTDTGRRDLVLAEVAANGASVELRRGDIFTEQGLEQSHESHESMDSRNERHTSPDNETPSSSLRFAPRQSQDIRTFASGTLSVLLPVDSTLPDSNNSSETELTRAFFKTQRQYRLAINTLRKIGGAGGLVELDCLPTEDTEVVDICEKATQNHETMLQNGRQEAAKYKAELAYLMVDKMQHGKSQNFTIQSVANNWGIGVDVPRQA